MVLYCNIVISVISFGEFFVGGTIRRMWIGLMANPFFPCEITIQNSISIDIYIYMYIKIHINCQNHQPPNFDCWVVSFFGAGCFLFKKHNLKQKGWNSTFLEWYVYFQERQFLYHKKNPDRNTKFRPEPGYELIVHGVDYNSYKWRKING